MADIDPTSWADRLTGTRPRLFNLVHQTIISAIFFMSKFGIVTIDSKYAPYFDLWVAVNLIAMAAMLVRRPFSMPRVADKKCLSCGHVMVATSLVCKNCGGKWTNGNEEE